MVDFAGSNAAMTDEEIAKVTDGVELLQSAGEIVLAYNHAHPVNAQEHQI